jgi:Cys-tRNA(Pro)/Cys-tRNA(Cys) deacylase
MVVAMAKVNNVTRFLDARKVNYTVFELPVEKISAVDTARLLGVDPALVFKTIVITREKPKKPILALIPGSSQVDLKKVATCMGEKKVTLPTERDAEGLTGLQSGGISPLALLNKGFQVLLDASAQEHQEVHISGGQRGLNLRVPVADLVRLTNARLVDILRHEPV